MSIKEPIKLYTSRELDLARKQGYEIAESLYQKVIENLKKEYSQKLKTPSTLGEPNKSKHDK